MDPLLILKDYGLYGLSLVIIFMLVKNQKGQHRIATNHLHGLPEMANDIKEIALNMREMRREVKEVNDNIIVIRTKVLNGNGSYPNK